MPRLSKKADVVSLKLTAKKLCPHCGHDEFHAIKPATRFSWLFGQKFVCAKCKGTFRRANLVKVRQKEKHYYAQHSGGVRKTKGRRRK